MKKNLKNFAFRLLIRTALIDILQNIFKNYCLFKKNLHILVKISFDNLHLIFDQTTKKTEGKNGKF